MFGPRIVGENGTELRPPTLEDYRLFTEFQMRPEVTRFWGPRFSTETVATAEERLKRHLESGDSVSWSIVYQGETVGFIGVFDIVILPKLELPMYYVAQHLRVLVLPSL